MKNTDSVELIKDERWEVILGAETFESFKRNIVPDFFLKTEVPEEIQSSFDIIKKVLCFSYFEYELIDVALTNAVFAFEKALKIRYRELYNKKWKRNFKALIDDFSIKNYFEISNNFVIHQLREIRNFKVHDTRNGLGGLVFLNKIRTLIDLTNDLYEDVDLRMKRMELLSLYEGMLKNTFSQGAILSYEGKRLIIGFIYPIFINNKHSEMIHSFTFIPIFDPASFKNDKPKNHKMINVHLYNLEYDEVNRRITGLEVGSNNLFELNCIADEANKEKFRTWERELDEMNQHSKVDLEFLINIELNKFYLETRRHFLRL